LFSDFLNGQRYSSNQIEFVNMIIDHLTMNGVMEPEKLFGSPYTDFSPNGVSGLFSDGDAEKILKILDDVRVNAAAA